jgi:superfamily II DNA or RNA helicase
MEDFREALHKRGLNLWYKAGCRGTLEYGTGSGKSWCGIKAMDYFYNLNKNSKFLIAVPRITLFSNWEKEITKAKKKYLLKNITFTTYHSLTKYTENYDLVILDEVHHITTYKRLQFFTINPSNKLLGLTAKLTYLQKYKLMYQIPIVDTFSLEEANEKEVVSDYEIFLLPVDLTLEEKINYNLCTTTHDKYFNKTKGKVHWSAINERKEIIYKSSEKLKILPKIVNLFKDEYGVIFTLSIDTAKKIEESIENCKSLHSKLSKKEVTARIKDFSDGRTKTKILATPTMLDEGITLPRLTYEILLDRFSKERQSLQTVGRGVRLEKDKNKLAIIVRVYCRYTVEEKWVNEAFSSFKTTKVNSFEELETLIKDRRGG